MNTDKSITMNDIPSTTLRAAHLLARNASGSQVSHWLRSLVRRMIRAYQRRSTYRQLMQLDDRSLWDIGLKRSEINSMIHELYGDRATTPSRRRVN